MCVCVCTKIVSSNVSLTENREILGIIKIYDKLSVDRRMAKRIVCLEGNMDGWLEKIPVWLSFKFSLLFHHSYWLSHTHTLLWSARPAHHWLDDCIQVSSKLDNHTFQPNKTPSVLIKRKMRITVKFRVCFGTETMCRHTRLERVSSNRFGVLCKFPPY